MTQNNSYGTHKACELYRDCVKCKSKPSKPKDILLECGEGTGSRTFSSSSDAPFQLAFVTVDTTCLAKPEVLIKFSSLVKAELVVGAVVRLKYELFRSCDDRPPLSIGTWMYEKKAKDLQDFTIVESIEESFDFIFCECKAFNACCDYFVIVTPIEITGDGATATVRNGRMAALKQGLCDNSKKGQKIILACGNGNSASQNIFPDFFVIRQPTNLAQVTIDTTCLNKPRVLVEFSSVIAICNQTFNDIVLQFELFKVCGDSKPVSCGTWIFEETDNVNIQFVQEQIPFSFIYCECLNISECCIYFVTVTALQASNLSIGNTSTWEVCNTQINAYAQSSMDDAQYKSFKDIGDYAINKSVHSKPQKAILECGTGNGSRTFSSSLEEDSFQLAQVSIETSYLCKPVVNIEFSSTVSFEEEEGFGFSVAQLKYELFRSCEGGTPISIGVWIVDRFPMLNDTTMETVRFTYCDCITCPGCCDYFVTATPVKLLDNQVVGNATITVGNGRIAAFAQGR